MTSQRIRIDRMWIRNMKSTAVQSGGPSDIAVLVANQSFSVAAGCQVKAGITNCRL